jgi:hypothetical protein
VVPQTDTPLHDGRQSAMALTIRRGLGRYLRDLDFAMVAEMTLASRRRADIVALDTKGTIWIVEIKSSLEDLRADAKWPEYRPFCDRLYFATHPDVPLEPFPHDAGLILCDGYGAESVREAPEHRLNAARRKAVILRFARQAALRLHDLMDPGV